MLALEKEVQSLDLTAADLVVEDGQLEYPERKGVSPATDNSFCNLQCATYYCCSLQM